MQIRGHPSGRAGTACLRNDSKGVKINNMKKKILTILLVAGCMLAGCGQRDTGLSDKVIPPDSSSSPPVVVVTGIPETESQLESTIPNNVEESTAPTPTDTPVPKIKKETPILVYKETDLVYPESYDIEVTGIPEEESAALDTEKIVKAVGDLAYEQNLRMVSLKYLYKLDSNMRGGDAYLFSLNDDITVFVISSPATGADGKGEYICTLDGAYAKPASRTRAEAVEQDNAGDREVQAPDSFEIRNFPEEAVPYVTDTARLRNETYAFLNKNGINSTVIDIIDGSATYEGTTVSMLAACVEGEIIEIRFDGDIYAFNVR